MAGANSNIQITDLDFNSIKNNLKTFLQSQNVLQDYNYEGSALSVLLDILAYNTQYNAYYLNMVSNEMFLDTALQRNSVVSHAKLLNYVPKSAVAPTAFINLKVNQVGSSSLTVPKFTNFMSEAIDGVNYNFVTINSSTVNVSSNTAIFNNVEIKQGIPVTLTFTVDSSTNPTYTFEIPDPNVDTTSLTVTVQASSSNTTSTIYNQSTSFLELDGNSTVYFLQEGMDGNYQVYFGDGVLGNQLTDGNIVVLSYIITQGTSSFGANNFVLMDTISGYSNTSVTGVSSASQGSLKESINSIKFQAPKSYSAQNRAVTKDDYITLIQQNNLGYSFDAVNVWGGENNTPPVYGQVFVALKPKGALALTDTQKQEIISNVIAPISVMTVSPTVVDPDYTYLKLIVNVLYDPKKTTLTSDQISTAVTTAINNFGSTTLNTFNSTFSLSDLISAIQSADTSIITNEINLKVQKKFYPNLSNQTNYNLYFGVALEKGAFLSGITSTPALQYSSATSANGYIDGVYIEEVPVFTGGVQSISILNPGYSYQTTPVVTITGDGSGATAVATLSSGAISSIQVTNSGNNYTTAAVTIMAADNDTTGKGAVAAAQLTGNIGTLRTYYINTNNVKTVLNSNVGTIDYQNGLITLNEFNPYNIDNPLGELTITANPATTIISSTYDKIITIDPYDSTAIVVNVTAKT